MQVPTPFRHAAAVAVAFLVLARCATAPTPATATATLEPEIRIEQLPASAFELRQKGALSIAYQVTVHNRSADAITLRSLDLKTVGRSPYSLQNTPASFNETIEPGQEKSLTFSMWAYPRDAEGKSVGQVWVEGTAHFESNKSPFQTRFNASFRPPSEKE